MITRVLDPRLAACCVLLASTACKGAQEERPGLRPIVEILPSDPSAPRHEESIITEAEYRHRLARVRLEREGNLGAAPLEPELERVLLDRLIDERILLLEAIERGVDVSTSAVAREVAAIRAPYSDKDFGQKLVETYQTEEDLARSVRDRLRIGKLLQREVFQRLEIEEAALERAWAELPASAKVRHARVHAAQIVVRTEEEGRAVVSALSKKGAEFAAVARERSVAPEAERGGDLGWFEAGVMPATFDEVCFALKPGEVSPLTASEHGFHVFKVLEAEDEVPLTYQEARPDLERRVREERSRAAEAAYLATLRSKVRIQENGALLGGAE